MIINWITHLPTPYRAPVYEHIQEKEDLQIQLTERSDRIGQVGSQNRGADWRRDAFPSINFVQVRTLRLHWHDVPLFVLLSWGAARRPSQADVMLINGWEVPAYWQALLMCKVARTPVINFYESPANTAKFSRGPVNAAKRFFFRRCDAVVTPGLAATDAVLEMGVSRDRIFEGFNAVDVRQFAVGAMAARSASADDGASGGWRFLYVGQLIERKRVVETLEAFASSAAQNATLTFVGSGKLLNALKSAAGRLGVADRVHFEPHVANARLPSVYARHDALILASDEEVWGLVVNEALAAGLRAVITENCGVTPSVRTMKGVHVVREDLGNLGAVLGELSVARRPEPIDEPAILRHTPKAFGDVFIAAAEFAVARGRRRPR